MNNSTFCNNCGNNGHIFYQCKQPITSVGVIVYRSSDNDIKNTINPEYLLIRRKDTIGYVEFMRGKYNIHSKMYLLNIISEMTNDEKTRLLTETFDFLWNKLWGNDIRNQYRSEEKNSRDKFESLKNGIVLNNDDYSLETLINEANKIHQWEETEWGFPKGRHNNQEKDLSCALREFEEETGISRSNINIIHNIIPFEEIFTGSNYKSYKHKYYVAYMNNDIEIMNSYQHTEVSKMEWKSYESAMRLIRSYNLEKKEVLTRVNTLITNYSMYDINF